MPNLTKTWVISAVVACLIIFSLVIFSYINENSEDETISTYNVPVSLDANVQWDYYEYWGYRITLKNVTFDQVPDDLKKMTKFNYSLFNTTNLITGGVLNTESEPTLNPLDRIILYVDNDENDLLSSNDIIQIFQFSGWPDLQNGNLILEWLGHVVLKVELHDYLSDNIEYELLYETPQEREAIDRSEALNYSNYLNLTDPHENIIDNSMLGEYHEKISSRDGSERNIFDFHYRANAITINGSDLTVTETRWYLDTDKGQIQGNYSAYGTLFYHTLHYAMIVEVHGNDTVTILNGTTVVERNFAYNWSDLRGYFIELSLTSSHNNGPLSASGRVYSQMIILDEAYHPLLIIKFMEGWWIS